MKIEYKFVTGEDVYIEVYGDFEEIMLELDKNLKNNDRKETRRHESLSLFDKAENNMEANVDVYEDVIKNLDRDRLYYVLQKLKPKERELLHNLYFCKNPISQIELARIKNISVGSIKMQLQRIKAKLKKLL